jgi:hypothetical protein
MTTSREKGVTRINEILSQIDELLAEATDIADEEDIEFTFSAPESEPIKYKPAVVWEASTSCSWETSDTVDPGYWVTDDSWNNSSANC